jgi:hypothetical protein
VYLVENGRLLSRITSSSTIFNLNRDGAPVKRFAISARVQGASRILCRDTCRYCSKGGSVATLDSRFLAPLFAIWVCLGRRGDTRRSSVSGSTRYLSVQSASRLRPLCVHCRLLRVAVQYDVKMSAHGEHVFERRKTHRLTCLKLVAIRGRWRCRESIVLWRSCLCILGLSSEQELREPTAGDQIGYLVHVFACC